MNASRNRFAAPLFIAGLLLSSAAWGQSSDDQSKPPEQPVRVNTDSYAVSLGTGELIRMSGDDSGPESEFVAGAGRTGNSKNFKDEFFYGLSVATVYTNSFASTAAGDFISTSVSPYLAVLVPTKTGSYVAQYFAVVNPNDTSTGGPQAYHTLALKVDGAFTRRWSWEINLNGSYGSESARFQAPLSFVVVQSAAVGDPSSAAVLLRTKNVVFSQNAARLTYLASVRDSMGWTFTHTYTGIEGDPTTPGSVGAHSNSVGLKMDYGRIISNRITLRAYAQGDTLLGTPTCNSIGGGLGMSLKINHTWGLDVQGGPQRNSNACGGQQSANFSGTIVGTLRNNYTIYASAHRVFTTAYRVDGTWEDDASAGLTKRIRRLMLVGDAGYVRGQPLLVGAKPYRGYYVSPLVRVKATESLGFSAGYRSFHGTGGALVSGNISYAVVSLDWYPAAIHFK